MDSQWEIWLQNGGLRAFSRLWLAINAFVEIVQIPDERNGRVGCWAGPDWAGWAVHYDRAVPAPLPEADEDAISIVELLVSYSQRLSKNRVICTY